MRLPWERTIGSFQADALNVRVWFNLLRICSGKQFKSCSRSVIDTFFVWQVVAMKVATQKFPVVSYFGKKKYFCKQIIPFLFTQSIILTRLVRRQVTQIRPWKSTTVCSKVWNPSTWALVRLHMSFMVIAFFIFPVPCQHTLSVVLPIKVASSKHLKYYL